MQRVAELKDMGLNEQVIFFHFKNAFKDDESISVIACPVDYFEEIELTDKLAPLTYAL